VKNIQHLLAHKNFHLTLAIGWTLLILVLCLVSFKKLPSVNISEADKYVHSTFHFVFTVLWYVVLKQRNFRHKLICVFFASVIFGSVIEILQGTFTATRQADIYDVFANSFGAFLAVSALYIYSNYLNKKAL